MQWTDQRKAEIFSKMFSGRKDVFSRYRINEKTGVRKFFPVCANAWSDGCHLLLKDGGGCANCKIKQYEPVSENSILQHVYGEEQHSVYVLKEDNTVDFCAVDFDCKIGKEKKGHSFDDVKLFLGQLNNHGIYYRVARSTGNGFHVYIFFSAPAQPAICRTVIIELFELCGFAEEARQQVRPLPEIFPKQDYATDQGIGNAIKPPMIESRWLDERNCLVTDENIMIPIEYQWQTLADTKKNDPAHFQKLVDDNKWEVIESGFGVGRSGSNVNRSNEKPIFNDAGEFIPRSNASFKKIIEGCNAFKQLERKVKEGHELSHNEGFGLFHMAINTRDGYQWFMENTQWGRTDADMRQLKQSIDKGYSPWTCKKLQEMGICPIGTKCLEKKPPVGSYRDGALVKEEVPPDQWPEPSPIRYGMGRGEAFMKKLLDECEEISKLENTEEKRARSERIVRESMCFDDLQQETLKMRMEELKIGKKSILNSQFKSAKKSYQEETTKIETSRSDTFVITGMIFRRNSNPYGYSVTIPGKKGGDVFKPFSDFVIDIEENRRVIFDAKQEEEGSVVFYIGKLRKGHLSFDFRIKSTDFDNNTRMSEYFSTVCGIYWTAQKNDLDLIRTIALHSASQDLPGKPKAISTQVFSVQGWYKDQYLMPSVVVSKDGLHPNTESKVDLSIKGGLLSFVDFQMLGDGRFKELLIHLNSDFFNAFDPFGARMGLGFCMMAGIWSHLKLIHKPTLWFEGDSGNGKSSLCKLLFRFWGDLRGGLIWTSTVNAMMENAYLFKDCLLMVDDYKAEALGPQAPMVCMNTIQNSYDEFSCRAALNKGGNFRAERYSRCNLLMNGEETPVNQTSVISRMTLIQFDNMDTNTTKPYFEKCLENQGEYNGITPQFIHYVLNQDKKVIMAEFESKRKELKDVVSAVPNSERIAYNITYNYLGYWLFEEMMIHYGVIGRKESNKTLTDVWNECKALALRMAERCTEEKNGVIFINALREAIMLGTVRLEYYENPRCNRNVEMIGYINPEDPGYAVIYTAPAIKAVKMNTPHDITLYARTLGVQLRNMGYLAPEEEKGRTTIRKRVDGNQMRAWRLNIEKMGLDMDLIRLPNNKISSTKPPQQNLLNFTNSKNSDGII